MVGETGDYISGGRADLFNMPGTLDLAGDQTHVQVTTPTPFGGAFGYTMWFDAPDGSHLQVGEYQNSERSAGFSSTGSAGLDIFGDGRGCNMDFGRFIVKDIHLTAGVPDRFWAVYEQHCETPHAPSLIGEVRVGETASALPETVTPRAINWPSTDVGTNSMTVPVTVTAGGAGTTIDSAAIQGTNAADFHIVSDTCSGSTLVAAGTCIVSVRVTPTAAADRSAQLVVTDHAANTTTVDLAMQIQPDVSSIDPDTGPGTGGTEVTLTGRNFTGATKVTFGGTDATDFTVDSPTQITATTPPGTAPSSAGVEVKGAHGHSWAYPTWDFHYATAPNAPANVSAQAGPAPGRATVNFVPSLDGGSPITSYTVTASPGGAQATGTTWPIEVDGLDDVATYTFTVTATNAIGTSPPSNASNAITTLRPTTTVLSVTPANSVFGTPLDLTATVSSTFSGTPTGDVVFAVDHYVLGGRTIDADGHTPDAVRVVPDVGSTLSAKYQGDLSFAASEHEVAPNITPAHTAVTLTSSANPVRPGREVTIVARVENTETLFIPFGSVQFFVNGEPALDPLPLDFNGAAGIVASLPAGTYDIRADYVDDTADIPDFVASTATLTQFAVDPVKAPAPIPTRTTQPPPTSPAPTPKTPDNTLIAGKPTVKRGVISLSLQTNDTGALRYSARTIQKFATASRKATVLYASGKLIARGGQATKLTLRPTARAKRLLAKKKRLKLRLNLTFQSSLGGKATNVAIPVTVTNLTRRALSHR